VPLQPRRYVTLTALTQNFIRREIDAINKKWHEIYYSDRKGEVLAIDYRLYVHPNLWDGIQKYLANRALHCDTPRLPESKFLELPIKCDAAVEGWLILPVPLP
jgi:hypothetical protein